MMRPIPTGSEYEADLNLKRTADRRSPLNLSHTPFLLRDIGIGIEDLPVSKCF